ncbi:MAG: hypothetical protein J6T31_03710, partial [Methanobrevibacter sp.]|nr:hypothetical protein [Methanobrevibacter sp.]
MNSISLTITTKDAKGVLDEITDVLSNHGINISYVHLYVKKDVGTLNLEQRIMFGQFIQNAGILDMVEGNTRRTEAFSTSML